eukprot:TRINITY_DN17004_c0_g1_i1.p1 TRINITY_DN17004_c0_g1~~TRINITY_DN17004_c0_g1_i1.p1  ORF type:complete len:246 (+),score=65.18 TRINITY_DN17004_c0_g1_i1:189-926(+)
MLWLPGVIKIKAINEAPFANITESFYNFTGVASGIISGNVGDPDAGFTELLISVTIEKTDGSALKNNENITLNAPATTKKVCVWSSSRSQINCTESLLQLNSFLSQITLSNLEAPQSYTVTLYINDLGNGADPSDKQNPATHLTAVATTTIRTYTAPSMTGSLVSKNNNAMTGILVGSAAAGVLVGLYRVLKKKKPSNFFGEDELLGRVNDNPLYKSDSAEFENPLYVTGQKNNFEEGAKKQIPY